MPYHDETLKFFDKRQGGCIGFHVSPIKKPPSGGVCLDPLPMHPATVISLGKHPIHQQQIP